MPENNGKPPEVAERRRRARRNIESRRSEAQTQEQSEQLESEQLDRIEQKLDRLIKQLESGNGKP